MKKLLVGIVTALTILLAALSSASYAEVTAGAQSPNSNAGIAPNNTSSQSLAQNLKAQLLAALSALVHSDSPIAGVVVLDPTVVHASPPLAVPPDNPPPGIPVDDEYVKCDGGWDDIY